MAKKKINRGGLIPYFVKDGEIHMLFMKPSRPKYGGDSFQIAKGKQEPNEGITQTAIREAGEELGLFTGNIVHLDSLGVWLGRTTIFIAEIKDPTMFGDPTTPDEVKEVKWMTLPEFMSVGRGLHKAIVQAAHRKMEQMLPNEPDNN
jgi:8-oxo-dGTP pyrophosphatase MutT (NUDIX family)